MLKLQTVLCIVAATCVHLSAIEPARAEGAGGVREITADERAQLRGLIDLAKQRAPEVSVAQASLSSSRSSLVAGRMAPLGNPYLEVTAERGNRDVTKDVAINGTLWLPVELSGQRGTRRREAEGFIGLHTAFVDQAKARAAARAVRAYAHSVVAAERATVLSDLLTSARAEAELMAERVKAGDAIARDASLAAVEAARHEVMLAETRADMLAAQGELAELLGRDVAQPFPRMPPPSLLGRAAATVKVEEMPNVRALGAEARYHAASAERLAREGQSPLSVGLVAGRGDYGETRLGGGLAYAFPVFRANRAERARATAESQRALAEKRVTEAVATRRLKLLQAEQQQVERAISTLTSSALPAAQQAVSAVQETYAAGKTEMLAVLLSRRELSALSLRRLELLERNWLLVSEYVEITGDLP